jgi:hypothetical protein
MRYIDMTPTWVEILPTWLMMFEQAIIGGCSNPDLIKSNARGELAKMAAQADRFADLIEYLEVVRGHSQDELQEWTNQGRQMRENERFTEHDDNDGAEANAALAPEADSQ